MLRPEQIRAARALVNWSRSDLAAALGISERTLASIESGESPIKAKYLRDIVAIFDGLGVEFVTFSGGAMYGLVRREGSVPRVAALGDIESSGKS